MPLRIVAIVSYTIAFLAAAALTIYIVAYLKPPRQWHWHCRQRGRLLAPENPSTSSSRCTFTVDEGNRDRDKSTEGWGLKGHFNRRCRGGVQGATKNSTIPIKGIRRTVVYIVKNGPAPVGLIKPKGTRALPGECGERDGQMSYELDKKSRAYGGGQLPWAAQAGGTANGTLMKSPPRPIHEEGNQGSQSSKEKGNMI